MNPSRNPVESLDDQASVFSALGDPTRLAVIEILRDGTTCVCELVPMLGIPQTLLSYHLRILREAGLVTGQRSGRRIEYALEPERLEQAQRALAGFLPSFGGVPA